jgi:formylglycine-generating enzyme required for sulfatase activity
VETRSETAVWVALPLLLACPSGRAPATSPDAVVSPAEGHMVDIPGGRFGRRRIAAFQIDRTEVTVAAYRSCVNARACEEPKSER